MKPPQTLDGATVLTWAYSEPDPFFVMCYPDGTPAAAIHGLAVCRYPGDGRVYRFSCNRAWEVENDTDHDSVEEAKTSGSPHYDVCAVAWKPAPESPFDTGGLNDFSRSVARTLFEELPWMEAFAAVDPDPDVRPGSLLVKRAVPPPRENAIFWLSTADDEVTVGFGMFHTHFSWPPDESDDVVAFVRDLTDDRILIEDRTRDGRWAGSSTVAPDEPIDSTGVATGEEVVRLSWSGRLDETVSGEGGDR